MVPSILWVLFRERSAFAEEHARRALNWQILILPAWIGASFMTMIMPFYAIATLMYAAIFIGSAIFCIPAGLAAYQGHSFRYPIDAEIVKKP